MPQLSIAAFAEVPGADAQRLAEALLECCLLEPVCGEPDQLHDSALRFILDHCTAQLEELFEQRFDPAVPDELVPPWRSYLDRDLRFIIDAMWTLPGPEGVAWMQRLLTRNPYSLVSRRPLTWTAEDWILRLNALSERDDFPPEAYQVTGVVLNEEHPPPLEASAALVRYACARLGHDDERKATRRAAAIVNGYRTGDPAVDVQLFWWDAASETQLQTLRWMPELSGPAGGREALVGAAVARGLINTSVAAVLNAPLDRPLWADGDVPWVYSEAVELGSLALPRGALAGRRCSVNGAFEHQWQVDVEPGEHPVRALVAVHPARGRANCAVEVVLNPEAIPQRWEVIWRATDGDDAVGMLGASPDCAPPTVAADDPAGAGWSPDDEHSAVWFGMPATGSRSVWVGHTDSEVTRVVLDLGRIKLDPATAPPPWFHHDRIPRPPNLRPDPLVQNGRIETRHLRELAERGISLREQRQALRHALHQRGVSEYASAIVMRHVYDGIALSEAQADVRSRLGGARTLPPGAIWPALEGGKWHLAFLAQLALSELPHVPPLPPDGTLLIYQETETWSCEHEPLSATRVMYVPEGVALTTIPEPQNVLFPLKPKPLSGVAAPIPGEAGLVVEALELLPDDRQLVIAAMNELMQERYGEHWLLGASRDVQGPARLDVRYTLATLPAAQRARFAQSELDGEGWILLAQINEDHTSGLGIGDGGSFYIFILQEDLQQRRFDRVVGLMQCH